MRSKRKNEFLKESEEQLNDTCSYMKTELSIKSKRDSLFKEIDLSATSIKKQLKLESQTIIKCIKPKQIQQYSTIQQPAITPIYSYRDYLNTFQQTKSEKMIQFHEARVRSISDTFSETRHNNNFNQQSCISENSPFPTNQKVQIHLSYLQSLSFQVDKTSVTGFNAVNFMKSYPINQILSQKDKKSKKIAGKAAPFTHSEVGSCEDGIIDSYNQFSSHQQHMLSFINLLTIIRNPNPEKNFKKLVEAQFFFFIIGDYKKLKRLQDKFLLDGVLNSNNFSSVELQADKAANYYNNFIDTDSSSKSSVVSNLHFDQEVQYDINDFISFKSQSTTSKLTKMQNSVINNPFQGFSLHQQQKYNPNRNQFYNLPKYTMVFILELLSQKNMKRLGIATEYQLLIQKIVYNVKKSAQIKEQKKKIMYNHNHYNCLFLTLNVYNTPEVMNQQDLKKLHMSVFGVDNLLNPFDNLYINILKKVIERIIMIQLQLIQEFPLTQYIITNKSLYQFEKSKINYVERVISGISKLREGEIIKRF